MKFEISEKVKRDAAKKGLSGICEAIDSIINTCDSRVTRNVLSGSLRSIEDALNQELNTKTILSQTRQPAEVTHIEKEQKPTEKETGSIERATTSEDGDVQERKAHETISTKQAVSIIGD